MKAYIEEKTKEEAEKMAVDFFKRGIIISYGKAQEYIHHRDRGTGKVIYGWRIECEE